MDRSARSSSSSACRLALQSMLKVIIKAKETGLLERSATFAARFADMTISIAQVCAIGTVSRTARYPGWHGICARRVWAVTAEGKRTFGLPQCRI
jgi:hypothetical protein